MTEPAPSRPNEKEDRKKARLVYVLYILGIGVQPAALLGVVLAASASSRTEIVARAHNTYQVRLFLWGLLWTTAASLALKADMLEVGIVLQFGWYIWVLYRVSGTLSRLDQGLPPLGKPAADTATPVTAPTTAPAREGDRTPVFSGYLLLLSGPFLAFVPVVLAGLLAYMRRRHAGGQLRGHFSYQISIFLNVLDMLAVLVLIFIFWPPDLPVPADTLSGALLDASTLLQNEGSRPFFIFGAATVFGFSLLIVYRALRGLNRLANRESAWARPFLP